MTDQLRVVARDIMEYCDEGLPSACPFCSGGVDDLPRIVTGEDVRHDEGCLCDALRVALSAVDRPGPTGDQLEALRERLRTSMDRWDTAARAHLERADSAERFEMIEHYRNAAAECALVSGALRALLEAD